MIKMRYPVIDPIATGHNIRRLREDRGLSVRDLQTYFGFEEPRAIYKWQSGQTLPSVDNLYALGALLEVPMEDILVSRSQKPNMAQEQQAQTACCSVFLSALPGGVAASAVGTASETGKRKTHFAVLGWSYLPLTAA